ncbi:hypothetical protein Trco_006592 [Trichoderma cornu-damae]|uniref:UBC core domain-containing protein n=1 Tax=Trichoderma cornu-damae TaxID=654480 RepID=A0A9P8QGY2_9HYPO|nr:hypothetical protein Trco_006592 [Trichoderma cornu-damae]
MGSKEFNQDLATSKAAEISGVSGVRRGDSDGEVVFTWSPNNAEISLEIRILVLDVDMYPQSSSVMIFTESDSSWIDVSSVLKRLSASLAKKKIQAMIKAVAEKLLAKAEFEADSCETAESDDTFDSEDCGGTEWEYDDIFDGPPFARTPSRPTPDQQIAAPPSSRRLKKDLQIVQSAGLSVGVFPRRPLRDAEFFSLSLRVAKLGIPEHALEAWGLKDREYLVLLCRFPPHYPTIPELLETTFDEWKPEFRFGKCSRPKPSIETARLAFKAMSDPNSDAKQTATSDDKSEATDASGDFVPLYMSNSINMLMNGEFLRLLKMRRSDGVSWDEALDRQKFFVGGGDSAPRQANLSNSDTSDTPVSENAMPSLGHDYALDDEEYFSLPMVAMQFALRRLARCTKYCMVCHQRLEDEFEALKPYVCSSPLCTYQFVSLGLGSSIEHEIISNPYVVDLLISFFAAALASPVSLRQFPVGLSLKSVVTGSKEKPAAHIVAEACFYDRLIRFSPDDYQKHGSIRVGDSIVVVVEGAEKYPMVSILNGSLESHVCKVTEATAGIYTFEVVATLERPFHVLGISESEPPTQLSNPVKTWVQVWIFQYSHYVDNINKADQPTALNMILRGIPSVLDMRTHLLNNPSQGLASWNRIDKNSLTLLQWIVSSNRSLILQDDAVPDLSKTINESDQSQATVASNPNKVQGLPPYWMQFRFLQGTPERERLFTKELMAVSQSNSAESQFPTIFAWHGSRLENWHSIIRTGLDFKNVLNGRSFGHGVYMSNQLSVSLSYSGGMRNLPLSPAGEAPSHWPNSQLKPGAAISICEVINRPREFVAELPHYVVNKIEWIQCRYLFVAVDPTSQAKRQPFPTKLREAWAGCVSQCPSRELLSAQGKQVGIPLSALPSNRRRLGQSDGTGNHDLGPSPMQETPNESLDSDHGETDHELLADSDDEVIRDFMACASKRRGSTMGPHSKRSSKLTSAAHSRKVSKQSSTIRFKTDFVPGSLDLQSLPKLPEPSWAATSPVALKSLNRAIKELHEIQSKEDPWSLGWYIDFDSLENIFHWIVELHSFELELPLAQDMEQNGCTSIVLEFRFSSNFPFSPPFVRVIRPRFLPFAKGGGGHVTAGGAICSEMLTNSGWSAAMTIEKVLLQIRLGLTELDPPARLDKTNGTKKARDYGIGEAIDAYQRAAKAHGWLISKEDLKHIGYA